MSVAYRHVHDTVPAPSSLASDVPALIDTLVAQATAREPHDRPADATAMLVQAVEAHRTLPRLSGAQQARPTGAFTSPPAAPAHTLIQPRAEVPTPPPARSRGGRVKPVWFLAALAVIMVGAVAATGLYFAQKSYKIVPDLVGKNLAVAERSARAQGFQVARVEGRHDEKVAEGSVLAMEPVHGTEVEVGTTITLVPSLGPKRVLVPKTAGLTQDDARAAIGEAGLTVGKMRRVKNLEVQRNHVIRTSPQVGEKVKEGAKVDIYVSVGLVMPDVSGMPKDEAAAFLTQQGFQVQVNEVGDDAEPCTVIAQSPKPKSEVDQGIPAMVTVARCETDFWHWFRGDNEARDDQEFRIMPGVMGKGINDAKNELQAQGFRVRVHNLSNSGVVRFQRPGPNSERPPGSEVHLWH
ncbi:PASTA domain-containing protein [Nonomuraea ferruginea]